MDSVTQILLGSAVACAIAPKKYRKRAVLTGAVLGTLPDLDVLIHYASDIDVFTKHRSFSHSIFVLSILAVALLPLLRRLYTSMSWKSLYLLISLSLVTHTLLDALTSYGTQLFWPLSSLQPIYTASVFVIDPLYSIWLLLGITAYLITPRARWVNTLGLIISTAYLLTGLSLQQVAKKQLAKAFPDIQAEDWFVGTLTASPFCWHGVHVVANKYYIETAFNVLNPDEMAVEKYDINYIDKASLEYSQLSWFNSDTVARKKGKHLVSSDLRMGEFGNYLFEFVLSPHEEKGKRLPEFFYQWSPSKQNEASHRYRAINTEPEYPKRKWSQFIRCMQGGI